ncbi:hypothetical protein [Paenibacillus sp. CCS19]|uniref:hypothetical protein n=1 Tax=Paenibacillus sp. CCS19 TaxID=3158387 RepID=UPI00295F12AD|nr:hypothetical protein [Paenibacillus cellulosilyticus]
MRFIEEHAKWLQHHLKSRSGERKGRLERGHGHGETMFLERVWWPVFGNLDDLHPEYEVCDWRGRPYFLDLVWMPGDGRCKFAFEIKGFGPHVQQTDRIRYRQELNRETYLHVLGYKVIAIPYDDLAEQPDLTISLIKMLLSPYLSSVIWTTDTLDWSAMCLRLPCAVTNHFVRSILYKSSRLTGVQPYKHFNR